jgi:hypothetical protein
MSAGYPTKPNALAKVARVAAEPAVGHLQMPHPFGHSCLLDASWFAKNLITNAEKLGFGRTSHVGHAA